MPAARSKELSGNVIPRFSSSLATLVSIGSRPIDVAGRIFASSNPDGKKEERCSVDAANGLPVLHTRRLRLRIAGPETATECARFNRENAAFLAPWEPQMSSRSFDEGALREVCRLAVAAALEGSSYRFAISKEDTDGANRAIIGWISFTNIVRGIFQACNLGYKLAEDAQGYGYMTEAARAGIDFVFNTLRLHRIMANYLPHNHRSSAVLTRLGFAKEGYAKDYLFIDGKWQDHVLTALVNAEGIVPDALVL
jgi:ribosomal-protein-alanine N-acetyltransferase